MKQAGKYREQLHSLAYWVIRVTGGGIFFILTFFSLCTSQYMVPYGSEIPIEKKDEWWYHLLFAVFLMLAVFLLKYADNKLSAKGKIWVERVLLTGAGLWIGIWGFWWINSVDRVPAGDQAFVYGGASYFLEEQYSFLSPPGGYCAMYPHQLGLIALTEFLFLLAGAYNYYAFEAVCVVLAAGTVLMGYLLLRELDTTFGVRSLYLLFIVNCIPLICYTSWVYGDIPSVFFAVTAACCIARYQNHPRWYYLAGMVGTLTLAMLVRKNSMVLLVALCLLTVVYLLQCRNRKVVTAVALALLCSWLGYQGVYKMYEVRSGYPHSEGLPVNSWIAMGMQEENGICGWYNNMPKEVLYSLEYDYAATEDFMGNLIRERLTDFKNNPAYMVRFIARKTLSQWNEPLYQSVYFSTEYMGEDRPREGSFLDGVYHLGENFSRVFDTADRMQFLIYAGMLFYFLFAVKKENHPFQYLLAVNIIGGFLFSILWEAKARYSFPYYVTMYPLAAIGYFRLADVCGKLWKKLGVTCFFGGKTI